jgi:hypothetical protein
MAKHVRDQEHLDQGMAKTPALQIDLRLTGVIRKQGPKLVCGHLAAARPGAEAAHPDPQLLTRIKREHIMHKS